jgi:quercetin dioxygenase-like cupin family protein
MVRGPIPFVQTVTFDGVRSNIHECNIGEGLPKHQHAYDHSTLCIRGALLIRKEGKQKVLCPKDPAINLVAGEWHELEALEDGTIFINTFGANNSIEPDYGTQA